MRFIARFLFTVLAIVLVSKFVPGIYVASLSTALIVALIWGLLNITVKPILLLLTLPFTLITLGLFLFILNAIIFWLASSLVPGFEVNGFMPALFGSAVISAVTWVGNKLIDKEE